MDFTKKDNSLTIKTDSNVVVDFDKKEISVDDYNINFPWEYEKSWVLVEVKEYGEKNFYSLKVWGHSVVVIFDEKFEIKEEILSFFGDVDVLIINGTKEAKSVSDNIEARVIIPFGEQKDIFINQLGKEIEPTNKYKYKNNVQDESVYVNLV